MKTSNFLDQRLPDILISKTFENICIYTNPIYWVVVILSFFFLVGRWIRIELLPTWTMFLASFRSIEFCDKMVPRYLKLKEENVADDWQIKYGEKLIRRRNKLLKIK